MACKQEARGPRRDESAAFPNEPAGDIARSMDDVAVLLSCPYANLSRKHKRLAHKPAIRFWDGPTPSLLARSLRLFTSIGTASAAQKKRALKNALIESHGDETFLRRGHCRTGKPRIPRGRSENQARILEEKRRLESESVEKGAETGFRLQVSGFSRSRS